MARSKRVTGGIVASAIWLIIGTVMAVYQNSEGARMANIAARTSCRGQEDFRGCLDAYYAAHGARPEVDWAGIGLQLCLGLAVIWVVVLLLRMFGPKTE